MTASFILFTSSAVMSFLLVACYRRMAIRNAWLDIPNHRSSHRELIPRSGGLVILLMYTVLLVFQLATGQLKTAEFMVLAIPIGVGLVGFIDDTVSLYPGFRFLVYLLLVAIMATAFLPLPFLTVWDYSIESVWVLVPIYVLAITWLVNLFNFMDGINGIAGGQFIFVVVASYFLLPILAAPQFDMMLVVVASVVGFLCWNFPFGKVFLGDVGSTFLAAILAILMLFTITYQSASPWMWIILCASFIVDSGYTLIVRICTKQVWYHPHASHAYQILARRWSSHGKVVVLMMLVNIFWLWPLAWLATQSADTGVIWCVAACLPLIAICRLVGAGKV
ncbi:MAG: Fuc2NAc and GlcNAc transferase [Oceanicoccus sp.]|jgi:Fuc2NAc and GlcNAc transferase